MIFATNIELHAGKGSSRKAILESVSFSIAPERICALLGPSGSGKTTLLRAIAGLHSPDRGTIKLHEKNLEPHECAMAFQDPNLLNWISSKGNVLLPARSKLFVQSRPNASERASKIMRQLGLSEETERLRPHRLSRGMQSRVELSRALFMNRKVLLADEPFASLDYRTAKLAYTLISKQSVRTDHYCIIALHDLSLVAKIADDALILPPIEDGSLTNLDLKGLRDSGVAQDEIIANLMNLL